MFTDPEKRLPHRTPFLFVDEYNTTPDGKHITGSRTFTEKDFFFEGHFPGNPIVPGVILIETLAQCGGCGVSAAAIAPPGALYAIATLNKVKFHRIVRPGEKLEMEIKTVRVKRKFLTQKGKGFVNGDLAVEAQWLCTYFSPEEESK